MSNEFECGERKNLGLVSRIAFVFIWVGVQATTSQ